jgi:NADP-dependent aldehyde dehydrogenase
MTVTQPYDPRTGTPIGEPVPDTSDSKLDRSVCRAVQAGRHYQTTTFAQRADLLNVIAAELDQHRERIVGVADAETGLGTSRLEMEFGRVRFQLLLFAAALGSGELLAPISEPATPQAPQMTRILVPIGATAVFTASNFPLAFGAAGGDVVAALAAGCPVVVKAHPGHPRTDQLVVDIMQAALVAAGLPADTVAVVHGLAAGRALVAHPGIRAASFTGSLAAGRELFDLAVSRPDPIPFYGELGSINPVIVLPGAARERTDQIAAEFVESFTSASGQMCTKPGVVFIPRNSQLLQAIAARVADLPAVNLLNAGIADRFSADSAARARHATQIVESTADLPQRGYWRRPIIIGVDMSDLTSDLAAECFGPWSVLVTYDSHADIAPALEGLDGQLAAAIHAAPDDFRTATDLLSVLASRVGRVVWNGWPTGVAVGAATQHGGPWPATTAPTTTSVGLRAVDRFVRPVCLQNVPRQLLPPHLLASTAGHGQ